MPAPSPPADAHRRRIRHYQRSRAWCEWEDFDTWAGGIRADLARPAGAERPSWPPFLLLSLPGIDAQAQRLCASRWLDERLGAPEAPALLPAAPPRKPGPLRVGYLSSDFQQHATALLMIEMLEAHDPLRVETFAYSHGADDGKGMRERVVAAFQHFCDIEPLSDTDAAALMRADGLDLLVDLKGYTAGSRTALLAQRPAAVQVSFLGFPGTSGQPFIDYLISDRFITPLDAAPDYAEALACLPHSYQPHARITLPEGAAPERAAQGLPEEGFVFGCFNQAWKFTPEVFDLWCHLLRAVPGSVLWLLDDAHARGNLRNEALARGIEPQRLVFAPDLPQAAHLARLPLMDLMLDTWPYNAHTTASDALAAGVPFITCAGSTFASRVGGSLLHAAGLPELVTTTPADYLALALALATDRPRLTALRQRFAAERHAAALFDVPAYTAALETLFERMWARHAAGQQPDAIDS